MIKGITPALAEGGKIKIGGLGQERTAKSGSKYRMPEKYDHFVITTTRRNRAGDLEVDQHLMDALQKDSDGQVRSLPIVLHSDEIDEVFPTSYAIYNGKKLACRGDGENATRWEFKDGKRTGATKSLECPCDLLAEGKCKPHGVLHASIALKDRAVAGAVHKWRTTSMISIQRLIGSLQQILATVGTLRGLPLWLVLEPVKVSPDNAPASTVYCCHVELRSSDLLSVQQEALELAQRRKALSGGRFEADYRALVRAPAGDLESDEEAAEVQQEFYPDLALEEDPEAADIHLVLSAAAAQGREAFEAKYQALTPRERRLVSPRKLSALKEVAND